MRTKTLQAPWRTQRVVEEEIARQLLMLKVRLGSEMSTLSLQGDEGRRGRESPSKYTGLRGASGGKSCDSLSGYNI